MFIGGTGVISTACSQRAVDLGIDLCLLNRGQSERHAVPEGAEVLQADIRDPAAARAAIGSREFDVVADFVAFTPEHVQADVDLFRGRTGQYVFISSASAYQTPPSRLPVTESAPLRNPVWPYSQAKIACEELLTRAYRDEEFPATIVRPSHTYDRTIVPYDSGWTMIDRMRRGKEVVVHGDGTSLWVLTHSRDFAKAFVGLLGRPQAVGDSFHITSDEVLNWNQIHEMLAAAAGVEPAIVHVTSDAIHAADEHWGQSLLGDKTHSIFFDNGKVCSLVPDYVATTPFSQGAQEIVAWHDEDPARGQVDPEIDALLDRLVEAHRS